MRTVDRRAARGGTAATHQRRPARCFLERRRRLESDRRADGRADTTRPDVFDRIPGIGVRRAALCAPRRRTVRDRPLRAGRAPERDRSHSQAGLALQRAVRRCLGHPDVLRLADDAAACHRRAQRRRRRREFRRLQPLRRRSRAGGVRPAAVRSAPRRGRGSRPDPGAAAHAIAAEPRSPLGEARVRTGAPALCAPHHALRTRSPGRGVRARVRRGDRRARPLCRPARERPRVGRGRSDRPDARSRCQCLSRGLSAGEGRHRVDGPRSRGAIADARSRVHGVCGQPAEPLEGARRDDEVHPEARGRAVPAAREHLSPEARVQHPACALVPPRIRRLRARGPARRAPGPARLLPYERDSPAAGRTPTRRQFVAARTVEPADTRAVASHVHRRAAATRSARRRSVVPVLETVQ